MEGTMDTPTVAGSALRGALDQQGMAASLITKTLDRMNTNTQGLAPQVDADYAMQKDVLNAAYADKGIGTKLNVTA